MISGKSNAIVKYDFKQDDIFNQEGYPKLHFIEHAYCGDETNWWLPNRAATEAMLRNITTLGPLREHPRRMYQWSGDTPEDVGQRGEFAIPAILSAEGQRPETEPR